MLLTRPFRLAAALATGASGALPGTALAWNDYGHELAAYIAYQDLTPETRTRVNALLHEHPQYDLLSAMCPDGFDPDMYAFMRAATWPDMLRSDSNPLHHSDHHGPWHYINLPYEIGDVHGPQPSTGWAPGTEPENVIQAIAKCSAELADPAASTELKSKDICWIEHMIGDLHQPLHAVALFSADYPKGDQGGNLFFVYYNGQPVKLHALWDQMLGSSRDPAAIVERGRKLRDTESLSRHALADQLSQQTVPEWVMRSADLARTVVYDDGKLKGATQTEKDKLPGHAPALPDGYHEKAEKLVETQIVLAGYRLADQLNRLLSPSQQPEPKPDSPSR